MEDFMRNAKIVSEERKTVHFIILPDKFIRIIHNLDTWEAEIALKLNKVWIWNNFEVKKVSIKSDQVSSFIDIFKHLWYTQTQEWCSVISHNFIYDGVLIKLKNSDDWWRHIKLEVGLDTVEGKHEAIYLIRKLADKLWINLMNTEELKRFSDEIDKKHILKHNNSLDEEISIF